MVACWRCCTRCSMVPQPGVEIFPATATVAKSAKVAFIRATAAQPPCSLNSLRRNSFTQMMAHLVLPSSFDSNAFLSLSGLRTPIMSTVTFARLGLPRTTTRALPIIFSYSDKLLKEMGRPALRFCKSSKLISKVFSSGQIASSSLANHGVSFIGISYS